MKEDLSQSVVQTAGMKSAIQPITFTIVPLKTAKSPNLSVEYAHDNSRKGFSKLVFHFKNASIFDMEKIGKTLHDYVREINIPTAHVTASASPIFRNQWDFIMFDVPEVSALIVQAGILNRILDTFAPSK